MGKATNSSMSIFGNDPNSGHTMSPISLALPSSAATASNSSDRAYRNTDPVEPVSAPGFGLTSDDCSEPVRITLADGQTLFRQGLAALLRPAKELALLAVSDTGPAAWTMISHFRPDVAILGTGLTGISSPELARRVVEAGLETKLVMVGEYADPTAFVDAQDAGFAGYVLKQQPFDDLLMAVRTVAAGGSFAANGLFGKMRQLESRGLAPTALSPREREVARLIALGNTGKVIARQLRISPSTVNTYRERLMSKLNAHTVADVASYALRVGLVC